MPIRTLGLLHKAEGFTLTYCVMSDASELAACLFIFDGTKHEFLVWSRIFFEWGKDADQPAKGLRG